MWKFIINIYNTFVLKIYNLYFKSFKINDNQSLEYQLMIILMHIHRMKRFGITDIGLYIGDNFLYLREDDIEKVNKFIEKNLSYNNKHMINFSGKPIYFFYGMSLENKNKNGLYKLEMKSEDKIWNNGEKNKDVFIFQMTDKGYSYQYNGYKRSEVRLQDKANLFAMVAIFGASFSWLVDKNFINYKSYASLIKAGIIYSGIATVYFFRKKKLFWLFIITIGFLFLYFLHNYFFSPKEIINHYNFLITF